MIYFIFLASLASATCYLAYYWRNMTEFRLRKQLVNLSTRWLVYLPCYSVFYLPYLQATCSLVHSLTCLLTMLLCLLFTLSTSNLFTRPLVDLSTYHVTLYSCSGLSAGRTVLHPTATAVNPSWYGKNQNYYSNSRLDLDSLIIYDKEKYTYSYLSLSRDTYERLHNSKRKLS